MQLPYLGHQFLTVLLVPAATHVSVHPPASQGLGGQCRGSRTSFVSCLGATFSAPQPSPTPLDALPHPDVLRNGKEYRNHLMLTCDGMKLPKLGGTNKGLYSFKSSFGTVGSREDQEYLIPSPLWYESHPGKSRGQRGVVREAVVVPTVQV